MKIEITKHIPQVETIEVELPYFYECVIYGENYTTNIYGKIDEKMGISFTETKYTDGDYKIEIEKCPHHSIKNSGLSSYFNDKYKSTKDEFESIREKTIKFLTN